MSLLSIGDIRDVEVVSIPALDGKYQDTAQYVLIQLLTKKLLDKHSLSEAQAGAGNNAEIAMLRWLLHHRKVTKLQIHRAMREHNANVEVSEMVQFTSFLAPDR